MQTCACPAKAERSRQDNKEGNYESDSCSGFFPFFSCFTFKFSAHVHRTACFFADSNTLTPISRPLAASPSRTCTVACKINSLNINPKPARNQCNLLCFIVRLFPMTLNRFQHTGTPLRPPKTTVQVVSQQCCGCMSDNY